MLEQLEVYVDAQKAIAQYMLVFGLVLLVLAMLLHAAGAHALFIGLKTGLVIFGLISCLGGYGDKMTTEKLLHAQTKLYHENRAAFHSTEKVRMAKVVQNFAPIQAAYVALVCIALVAPFFVSRDFINGLLFALVVFSVGNMVIERISKTSISVYHEQF